MSEKPAKGVVAILTGPDGRVWATATDFERQGYGGFSLQEAQEVRVKQKLAHELVRQTCSDIILSVLRSHDCEEIVSDLCRLKGFTRTILPIGHGEPSP